jgi:hypothetical protein
VIAREIGQTAEFGLQAISGTAARAGTGTAGPGCQVMSAANNVETGPAAPQIKTEASRDTSKKMYDVAAVMKPRTLPRRMMIVAKMTSLSGIFDGARRLGRN